MKLHSLLAAALLVVSVPATAVEIGAPAPEVELPGLAGPVKLSALRGKVVYLDIWASWCGPCRQSFPWLNEMQAKYGAQGLTVVGVNVDAKRADAEAFLKDVPARFTVAFDPKGETPSRYAAKGMPTSYLIGRDGRVLASHVGFRPQEASALEAKIRDALGMK